MAEYTSGGDALQQFLLGQYNRAAEGAADRSLDREKLALQQQLRLDELRAQEAQKLAQNELLKQESERKRAEDIAQQQYNKDLLRLKAQMMKQEQDRNMLRAGMMPSEAGEAKGMQGMGMQKMKPMQKPMSGEQARLVGLLDAAEAATAKSYELAKTNPVAYAIEQVVPQSISNIIGGKIKEIADVKGLAKEGLTTATTGASATPQQQKVFSGFAGPGGLDALLGRVPESRFVTEQYRNIKRNVVPGLEQDTGVVQPTSYQESAAPVSDARARLNALRAKLK